MVHKNGLNGFCDLMSTTVEPRLRSCSDTPVFCLRLTHNDSLRSLRVQALSVKICFLKLLECRVENLFRNESIKFSARTKKVWLQHSFRDCRVPGTPTSTFVPQGGYTKTHGHTKTQSTPRVIVLLKKKRTKKRMFVPTVAETSFSHYL